MLRLHFHVHAAQKLTKALNIISFNGYKFYKPDLQINEGQCDSSINEVYYQVEYTILTKS